MKKKPEIQDYNLDEKIISSIKTIDSKVEGNLSILRTSIFILLFVFEFLFISTFWRHALDFFSVFFTFYPGFLFWYLIGLGIVESNWYLNFTNKFGAKLKNRYFNILKTKIFKYERYQSDYSAYKNALIEFERAESESKRIAEELKTKKLKDEVFNRIQEFKNPLNAIIENLKYKKDYDYILQAYSDYSPKLDEYRTYLKTADALAYGIETDLNYFQGNIGWIHGKLSKSTILKNTIKEKPEVEPSKKIGVEAKVKKSQLVEIVNIKEVFNDIPNSNAVIKKREPAIRKVDYQEQNIKNATIGLLGEEFIYEYELKKLNEINRKDLTQFVDHVSKREGDGLGYDIISFNENGDKIFIEVKTTTGGVSTQFFISSNELNVLSNQTNYCIYRVFDFNTETKKGKIIKIEGKNEIEKYFDIEPTNYKVMPRVI